MWLARATKLNSKTYPQNPMLRLRRASGEAPAHTTKTEVAQNGRGARAPKARWKYVRMFPCQASDIGCGNFDGEGSRDRAGGGRAVVWSTRRGGAGAGIGRAGIA